MMPAQRPIRPELYQHEKDKKLISEIMNHPVTEKVFCWLRDQKIDDVYTYVYQESCIRLTRESSPKVTGCLERACRMLGCAEIPQIYLIHDYNRTIEICGIGKPFLLVSSFYLKALRGEGDAMLTGILGAQAAAICAGHHRGLLLIWSLNALLQQMSLPRAAVAALESLLNDWKRCRMYTCDRAFLALTGDYPLAIRSIFLMRLPGNVLYGFRFGSPGDLYREQMEGFVHADGLDNLVNFYNSAITDQSWLPLRYQELEQFAQRTGRTELRKTDD